MKKRVLNVLLALCMVLCLVLFAGCAQQQLSPAERTEVRNSGTAIQWKYSDETDWHDLVTIAELTGAAEKRVPTVLTARTESTAPTASTARTELMARTELTGKI